MPRKAEKLGVQGATHHQPSCSQSHCFVANKGTVLVSASGLADRRRTRRWWSGQLRGRRSDGKVSPRRETNDGNYYVLATNNKNFQVADLTDRSRVGQCWAAGKALAGGLNHYTHVSRYPLPLITPDTLSVPSWWYLPLDSWVGASASGFAAVDAITTLPPGWPSALP